MHPIVYVGNQSTAEPLSAMSSTPTHGGSGPHGKYRRGPCRTQRECKQRPGPYPGLCPGHVILAVPRAATAAHAGTKPGGMVIRVAINPLPAQGRRHGLTTQVLRTATCSTIVTEPELTADAAAADHDAALHVDHLVPPAANNRPLDEMKVR